MEAVMDDDRSPLSFLGRQLPPAFERRVVVLAPEHSWVYEDAEWRGALVVVEQGQIELECLDGSRHYFGRGDVLWLERLPLRALHTHGHTSAVLVAVSRQPTRAEC
jgi:glyoxylase-like metal-dependent hydrolase (beta-lactamase superfamily II)